MGYNGTGTLICMLDTGYELGHQALQNINVVAEWDFINDDPNTAYDPAQDDPMQPWHGTITLSAAGGFYEGQLIGAAYGADFALAKTELVTDELPVEEDWWTEGSEWADSLGADIISSSLGYIEWYTYEWMNGDSCVTTIAADIAAYNGIVVSTAMGNEGNWVGSLIAPSDADSILACGAVNVFRELASFSSIGPTYDGRTKPEVVAQGVATYAVDPFDNNGYLEVNGTSLSTPLVGGLAAVVRGANPAWTVMETREAILMTADQAASPDNYYGWGVPDAVEALLYLQTPPVEVELAPDMTVVPQGGTLAYTATLTNTTGDQISFYARAKVILPNGNPYPGNPILGPVPVTLDPYEIRVRDVEHDIPPSAPLGEYDYVVEIGTPPNNLIDEDMFTFEVIESP
jgi:subtilisin family serine protease